MTRSIMLCVIVLGACAARCFAQPLGQAVETEQTVVETWRKAETIALTSPELKAAVAQMPENKCIGLPARAVRLSTKDLPEHVRNDLDTALTGLLVAYTSGGPSTVLDYMHERDEVLSPKWRPSIVKGLVNAGIANAQLLPDDELYKQIWGINRANGHWHGLAPQVSCRQVWDGKQTAAKSIEGFDINSRPGVPREQLEQAARNFQMFRSCTTVRQNFAPARGTLNESIAQDEQVLLCDVQFIIELDESQSHKKQALLCRFWFNRQSEKWQFINCARFAPHDTKFPIVMF